MADKATADERPAVHLPSDDALMEKIRRRDQAAFSQLLKRHLPAIHRYLTRMTGNVADSDELSQETFLRVWQTAGRYRPGRVRFTTWLHRIAHNLYVDAARKRRAGPLPEDLEVEDPDPGPEQRVQMLQQQRDLQRALMALPATQRSALLLCQVQGFSNPEAAAILRTGTRAVESLLARARRNLREQLYPSEQTNRRQPGDSLPGPPGLQK